MHACMHSACLCLQQARPNTRAGIHTLGGVNTGGCSNTGEEVSKAQQQDHLHHQSGQNSSPTGPPVLPAVLPAVLRACRTCTLPLRTMGAADLDRDGTHLLAPDGVMGHICLTLVGHICLHLALLHHARPSTLLALPHLPPNPDGAAPPQ